MTLRQNEQSFLHQPLTFLVSPIMSIHVIKISVRYLDFFSGAVSVLVALLLRVWIFTDSQSILSWKGSTRSSESNS